MAIFPLPGFLHFSPGAGISIAVNVATSCGSSAACNVYVCHSYSRISDGNCHDPNFVMVLA